MSAARSTRGWERAAPWLRGTGAVVLCAGLVHLYADRVLFDARVFARNAARSLEDPRVASFVAEQITDELVAQRRDLTGFHPLLVGTARAVVGSDPFRAVFQRAVERGHGLLFSEGVQVLALSVPDLGVLVKSALAQDPELQAKIPPSLRGKVSWRPSGRGAEALLKLIQTAHRFRRNAVLAIGAGIVLLFLGIALPRRRQEALLAGGAALAAAALVMFFLPPLGRAAVRFTITAPEVQPAALGLWDAFTLGLRSWALALAGIGVVLASAASSFARHVEIEELALRAWRRLQHRARTPLGEGVRGLLLVAIGLVAVFEPMATLQGLVVSAGALLAFEGLRELFVIVPPHIQEAAREAEQALAEVQKEHKGSLRTFAHHAVVGLLALVLIAIAILFLRSPDALPRGPIVTGACNGSRALCDRRLDQVSFPAAHNSMGSVELGWLFPNQELSSVSLLGRGIRGLQFDVHYGYPVGGRVKTDLEDEAGSRAKFEPVLGTEGVDAAMRIRDRLEGPATGPRAPYLCHGFCELGATPLVEMLEGVRDFMVRNPSEVLIFVIEDYVTPQDIEASFRQAGLERFVYRGPAKPPWPTLREMIDSDQRILVTGENETAGVAWYHPAFEVFQETPYRFRNPQELSCRANRGGTAGSLFQMNHWIETLPAPRPSNAAIVNAHEFLLARALTCEQERGLQPTLVAVDFAMTGDVLGVASELNGIGGRLDGRRERGERPLPPRVRDR